MKRSPGHVVFAVTLIVFGVIGLVKGAFTPIWLPVPRGLPARTGLAYLCALVFLVPGVGLLVPRAAAVSSRALLAFLLAWLLLLDLPQLLIHPGMELAWAASKSSVMVAAAWVLYVRLGGGAGLRIARTLYGPAMILFGIAHFTYLQRTTSMVPGWLPWHLFWAYFFGCTFIAGGAAIIIGTYARPAAVLLAAQLAMFTLLVWIPVVVRGPSASDWSEFVVSWVLTAAAWVVADSYRGAHERRDAS